MGTITTTTSTTTTTAATRMKGKAVAGEKVDKEGVDKEEELLLNGNRQEIITRPKEAKGDPKGTAPDGGWGWCVVLAGTVGMMMMGTQGPCFGVLYGQRLADLGASPSLGTWLFNIQSLIWNLTGPWAAPLNEVFTYRTIATAGSLLVASSLFFSPLVQNPYLLLLTFSVTVGLGGGPAIMSCYHSTALYFNKRLGLANGIVVTGGSLGLILMPQLASLLQDAYPFRWASFITGAVVLHCPVMMLLLHPIGWHRRAPEQSPEDPPQTTKEDASETQKPLRQGLLRGSSVPTDLLKLGGGLRREAVIAKRLRSGSECHTDTPWLEQRGSAFRLGGSTFMAGSVLTLQDNDVTDERQQDPEKQLGPMRRVWIKFRSQYNVKLMKDPLAMGVALATCLSITGSINIFAAIPFVLAEADYSLQDTATAMSVTAVVDLFTRMLGAFITDCPRVDVRLIYVFAQLIYIVVPYVLLCNSGQYWIMLACMAALGMGLGVFYLLDVLLVVRILGVHRMGTVMGLSQFFRCLAFIALGPAGGQLRDTTGSFFATVLFMSSVVLVGFLFLIFTTFTAHCCRPATPKPSPAPHRPRV
ncbi:monocarboxylate transporter 9-like isoform X2 [Scylla paramamosain]|uniref:monocarboxylate transporter 9-like isoform X2 n=2 Tax=Scylla paramamosain TaxID=85552 RepID=UPI0030831541